MTVKSNLMPKRKK